MATKSKDARAWQRMLSGRRLDLLEPSPLDVEIEDIAHGLARVARWNGQTIGSHAFSVAQHSVQVWRIFKQQNPNRTPDEELIALLHDAPEYVIGDMISPFKAVLGGEYKLVEARLQEAIHRRYGLIAITPDKLHKAIKRADSTCAYFEATELAGFKNAEAMKLFGQPKGITLGHLEIQPLSAEMAQRSFLDTFSSIEAARAKND